MREKTSAQALRRLADFLGLRRSMVGLLAMVVLVGLGERIGEEFLPVYLIALGGGVLSVGFLNGLDNLLSALYSFPGGYLSDRLGAKRTLVIFNLVAVAGFLLVVLIPSWLAVLGGAVLFIAWSAISLPATMSLVSKVLPKEKRTMGVSMHALVRRIPMAIGPVLGGAAIGLWGLATGVRVAFAAAAALALVGLVLQQALIEEDRPIGAAGVAGADKAGAGTANASRTGAIGVGASQARTGGARAEGAHLATRPSSPLALARQMSPPLRRLLVADVLARFCEQIPYAFVVVWCMTAIPHPVSAVQYGVLKSVEMATAILIYVPVAYLADRSAKKPFVVATFAFFTLFPAVLWFARSFWVLVLAFVLRGLKEFGEPTRKALILDLCPPESQAAMFGLYYLIRDLIVSVAAFGGAFLWRLGPEVNFGAAFLFGLAGTVWFAWRGTDLGRPEGAGSQAEARPSAPPAVR